MLKDISKYNFYGRSQFVRLRGKYTHQSTHCALLQVKGLVCWLSVLLAELRSLPKSPLLGNFMVYEPDLKLLIA